MKCYFLDGRYERFETMADRRFFFGLTWAITADVRACFAFASAALIGRAKLLFAAVLV